MSSHNLYWGWSMLLVGILLNVFGVYVVKLRINSLGAVPLGSLREVFDFFLALIGMPLVWVGGITIFIAPFPYAMALSKMQLSIAYPASVAINCLILIPLTVFFMGESFTVNKLVSLILLLASLYFLYK